MAGKTAGIGMSWINYITVTLCKAPLIAANGWKKKLHCTDKFSYFEPGWKYDGVKCGVDTGWNLTGMPSKQQQSASRLSSSFICNSTTSSSSNNSNRQVDVSQVNSVNTADNSVIYILSFVDSGKPCMLSRRVHTSITPYVSTYNLGRIAAGCGLLLLTE